MGLTDHIQSVTTLSVLSVRPTKPTYSKFRDSDRTTKSPHITHPTKARPGHWTLVTISSFQPTFYDYSTSPTHSYRESPSVKTVLSSTRLFVQQGNTGTDMKNKTYVKTRKRVDGETGKNTGLTLKRVLLYNRFELHVKIKKRVFRKRGSPIFLRG